MSDSTSVQQPTTQPAAQQTTPPAAQTASPAAAQPAADTAPQVHRAIQNTVIQKFITDADTFITTASTDEVIAPLLVGRGYDAAAFAKGAGLVKTARDAFADRATGLGKKLKTAEELHAAIDKAHDDYAAFREIIRGAFPGQPERVALGVTGDMPVDFQRFVSAAHASYTAAGKADYAAKCTLRGYGPAALATLLAALGDLTGTGSDQDTDQGDAQDDTEKRDAAYIALQGLDEGTQGHLPRRAAREKAPPRQARPVKQTALRDTAPKMNHEGHEDHEVGAGVSGPNPGFDAVAESRKWREAASRKLDAMSMEERLSHLHRARESYAAERHDLAASFGTAVVREEPEAIKPAKSFDAVAESRKWKEAVARETAGMTAAERIAWFRRSSSVEAIRRRASVPGESCVVREEPPGMEGGK